MRISSPPIEQVVINHELPRRKSDIENERLPPELFDAESEEGRAIINSTSSSASLPSTPAEQSFDTSEAINAAKLEAALNGTGPAPPPPLSLNTNTSGMSSTGSPVAGSMSPTSPVTPGTAAFRRGHGRQASLGTTMTSPSTRRRSIESTMSLIQGVWDGQAPPGDSIAEETPGDVEGLAGRLAGSSVNGARPEANGAA